VTSEGTDAGRRAAADAAGTILSERERERIAAALAERGARAACPACHENDWLIGDGYSLVAMRANLQELDTGGTGLATVSRICRNCGYLSQHVTRLLGIEAPGVE
jgi:ribosomal protein S27AE